MLRRVSFRFVLGVFVLAFAATASAHGRSRTARAAQSNDEAWGAAHAGLCDAPAADCHLDLERDGLSDDEAPTGPELAPARLHHHHRRSCTGRRANGGSEAVPDLRVCAPVMPAAVRLSEKPPVPSALGLYVRRL